MSNEVSFEGTSAGVKTLADDTLRVQIDIPPGQADEAFKYLGRRGAAVMMVPIREGAARVDERSESESDERKRNGKFWHDAIASGFFRAPDVLRAIGSEEKFEAWIRGQPSVLDGSTDIDERTGEIRNEPAHIRVVAEGSGTGTKPPYFAVPLTHAQHRYQHQKGYRAAYLKWRGSQLPLRGEGSALEWFQNVADRMRTEWATNTLKRKLNPKATSRTEISRDQVWAWVESNDLQLYWPRNL